MRRRALLASASVKQNESIPNNMIVYTTDDESIIEPYFNESFGAKLVSNTYVDGKGRMVFDGDITHIGGGAFQESYITNIEIPNSVTSIGDFAFYWCVGLTNFKVPDSVISIGESAFDFCIELTSITLGNSLSHIESWAFYDCDGLTTITIPKSVTIIESGVFQDCTSLESVYVKATTPPTLYPYVFQYNDSNRKIYVPRESLNAYKTASGWSEYADAIEPYDFDGSVNEITFYIDDGMYVTPMKALPNMTWGEFVNSEYANQNSMFTNFRLLGMGSYNGIKFYHEEAMSDFMLYVDYSSISQNIAHTDIIEDGKTYYAH